MINESPHPDPSPEFPGGRVAVNLGAALLIGLGLVLALVLRDNARHSTLEIVNESSAVGDTRYVRLPDPLPLEPFPPIAHLGDQPLIPAGYRRHEKREAEMQPVAKDKVTGLTIYQAPVKAKEAGDPPTYFLKAGPGEFIKARLAEKTDE